MAGQSRGQVMDKIRNHKQYLLRISMKRWGMYDKKDIKYYYLREVQCKLIVNIIIGLVVFNIIFTVAYNIPFPVKLKNFIEDVSTVISLFSGCTVISLFSFIFKNGQNETIGNSINKVHERIINRDIQKNKLLKLSRLHRIVILTGESGQVNLYCYLILKKHIIKIMTIF